MRVLLIGGVKQDSDDRQSLLDITNYIKQMFGTPEAVHSVHIDELLFTFDGQTASMVDGTTGVQAQDFDVVFIRGRKMRIYSAYAYYASRICESLGIPCVNSYDMYYPGTKFAQMSVFSELGAPFLKTVYAVDNQLLIRHAAQVFGYPYILKTNAGSHGNSNYLIRSEGQAQQVLQSEPDIDFLAQEFCPNDRDYRLLVVGSETLLFERRGGADTHINNTSQGGLATKVTTDVLPPAIVDQAHSVAQYLGLHIAGVDVMPHAQTGALYFLEINSQPQLRTGALLDEKQQLVKQFLQDFARK